jgi:predicted nucleic acid-binding protein
MRIYADPSFLVSWLYSADKQNRRARAWFTAHQTADWILSDWSRFETLNSLRSLCLQTNGPKPEQIEALRRYFNHLTYHGPFDYERVDWQEVMRDCNQVSTAFAGRLKARAADTLHVAILEQVNPDLFVSGDQDQIALAQARGFQAVSFI